MFSPSALKRTRSAKIAFAPDRVALRKRSVNIQQVLTQLRPLMDSPVADSDDSIRASVNAFSTQLRNVVTQLEQLQQICECAVSGEGPSEEMLTTITSLHVALDAANKVRAALPSSLIPHVMALSVVIAGGKRYDGGLARGEFLAGESKGCGRPGSG